jgi:hypothetical protein
MIETIHSKTKYFEESHFGCLLTEESDKIVFEPDMIKVEEFTKLKKPIDFDDKAKEGGVYEEP